VVRVPECVPDGLELRITLWSFLGFRRLLLDGWKVL
jgi:hypothetical protein